MNTISFIYSSLTPYFPLKEGNVNRPVLNALERQENEQPVKIVGKEQRTIKSWLNKD
jgi:ketol-acid reductoisomerase